MKKKNVIRAAISFGCAVTALSFFAGAYVGTQFPSFPWGYTLVGTICFLLGGLVFWMLKASNCTATPDPLAKKPQPQPKVPVQQGQTERLPKVKPIYDQDKEKPGIYDQDNP